MLFSLRQDFSSSFSRLLCSPAGTAVTIALSEQNLPMLARGRAISVTRGALVLKTAGGLPPTGFSLTIDGTTVADSVKDATLGDLPASALPGAFTSNPYGDHVFTIAAVGNLAPAAHSPGDLSAVDPALLLDMMVYLEYQFR